MHKVFIVAGMIDQLPTEKGYFVGVDYGALFLLNNGIIPDLAVGDFDSLTANELHKIKNEITDVFQAPPEKDDTDTQLALKMAIERYPNCDYIICGGTGGRLDHFLSNLFLPLEERFRPFAEQIIMIDSRNSIRFFLAGEHEITRQNNYKYLAFIPLITTLDFEIKDAKYELEEIDILVPTSYASNEFIGKPVKFSFSDGLVCVIESNDESSLR